MTENNHTLEPMFQFDFNQLATFENGRTPVLLTEDQYRRAQSCVNALEGLNDYALAGGWSFRGIEAYAKGLEKQRDELLAVAEHIQRCIPYGGFCQIHHGSATAADLDAAIASVKESK